LIETRPYLKKAGSHVHQECRSLLQKAVRRGDVLLVEKVSRHLNRDEDPKWVRMRTAIIIFEECWPLGAELTLPLDFDGALRMLLCAATKEKHKEAAGLGTLAYVLSTGDTSVLSDIPQDEQEHIVAIYKGIKNPREFWQSIRVQCTNDNQGKLVEAAHKAHRAGGWPWDKAFMQSAAYLAVTRGIPEVDPAGVVTPCPLWIGIDKHTPKGKEVLIKAASEMHISSRLLSWISFYCESAVTNKLAVTDTQWWTREIAWRLRSIGLDYRTVSGIWEEARQHIAKLLEVEATSLQEHLDTSKLDKLTVKQESLF
jgi:hypothetical protein